DHTPDQGFRSQFFRLGPHAQIHMNEIADVHQFRGHFCLIAPDFPAVFARAKAANAIDLRPWGRVRRLPNGGMQMFVRDPAGNLGEMAGAKAAVIDPALSAGDLVEPKPGMYRMAPGADVGAHESP